MFTELMPLLKDRTVLITVARESDMAVRVNAIPKRIKEAECAALTTPLSFTGTPEELDRDFPRALAEYVDSHQRLSNTLAQAKAEMEAAAKAAQEEARRKSDERRKAKATSPSPASSTSSSPVTPAEPAVSTTDLFGGAATQQQAQTQSGGLRL